MAQAELSVVFAGPLTTFQDGGRQGHMRFGVPTSGPMDRLSFAAANAALGNAATQTGIEVSLGGLILKCRKGQVSLAVTGGDFALDHAGAKIGAWSILTLREGESLWVRAGAAGSWAYVAFAGAAQIHTWLGSTATHSTSGFGGGALAAGDMITLNDAQVREDRLGQIPMPGFVETGPMRVVIGPQDHHFEATAPSALTENPFQITPNYDRMGMRLEGATLNVSSDLSIPSEPIVRGSIQVAGDGVPTILLADHQTTGGYPKIATVISSDIDRLVQMRSGQTLRFVMITPEQAVLVACTYGTAVREYLTQIAIPRGTLEQRLMRENLISGYFSEPPE